VQSTADLHLHSDHMQWNRVLWVDLSRSQSRVLQVQSSESLDEE
jgi:hypothetical protein